MVPHFFDFYSDFSAKGWNFREFVLGCTGTDLCKIIVFNICRDQILQDCHTFAPLETENLSKLSSNLFVKNSLFFNDFRRILLRFWRKLIGIYPNIIEKCCELSSEFLKFEMTSFWISEEFWWNFSRRCFEEVKNFDLILICKDSTDTVARQLPIFQPRCTAMRAWRTATQWTRRPAPQRRTARPTRAPALRTAAWSHY